MELMTAFMIGMVGSLHCIGMCGPIAISVPGGHASRFTFILGRIYYNSGRIIVYSLLGLIGGYAGQLINISTYQNSLSIGLGLIILLAVLLPGKYGSYITGERLHSIIIAPLKSLWRRLFDNKSTSALFVIGLLNGFLPCGLVYVALVGAIAQGEAFNSTLYMASFGLGTFPVLFLFSLTGKLFTYNFRVRLSRLIPVGAVMLALLLIIRGMSLGIPFISPGDHITQDGKIAVEQCH